MRPETGGRKDTPGALPETVNILAHAGRGDKASSGAEDENCIRKPHVLDENTGSGMQGNGILARLAGEDAVPALTGA